MFTSFGESPIFGIKVVPLSFRIFSSVVCESSQIKLKLIFATVIIVSRKCSSVTSRGVSITAMTPLCPAPSSSSSSLGHFSSQSCSARNNPRPAVFIACFMFHSSVFSVCLLISRSARTTDFFFWKVELWHPEYTYLFQFTF